MWKKVPLLAAIGLLSISQPGHALDLLSAYRLGLAKDRIFLAAQATAQAGREALPQAQAQLLPNLSLSSTQNSNDLTSYGTANNRPTITQQQYSSSNIALTLRQPLLRLQHFQNYRQAEHQVTQVEAVLQKEKLDLAIRVAAAYFDVLNANVQSAAIEAQISAYGNQLAAAQRAVELGTGVRNDADEAQARLDVARAQLLEARQYERTAQKLLANIIGQSPDRLAELDAARLPLDLPDPPKLDDWINAALDHNAELRAQRAQVDIALAERDKARAGHMPTLDLVAQRSKSNSDSVTTINTEYLNTSVGLQLAVPIFAGGYVNSQVRQAEANLDKARQQFEATRLNVELQVQKEFQSVIQGVAKVAALEQALRSAQQLIISTRMGLKAGIRTSLDILNAEQQLALTRRDLWLSRYQYVVARLKLKNLTGMLEEEDIAEMNKWLAPAGSTT